MGTVSCLLILNVKDIQYIKIGKNNLKNSVGARNPRFDPTAYIKDKERKKKEASMKK